jgi:hypothetical protein
MKSKKFIKIVQMIMKGGALAVWFAVFVVLVKPEVGEVVIPYLVNFSQAQARMNDGIDLDPIQAESVDDDGDPSSSLYSSVVSTGGDSISGTVATSDTRVVAMSRFLSNYHSPMAPYAEVFVASADNVGLDWRIVASISGVESGFGRITPYQSNNAWGWRGGPGGDFSDFEDWEEGIRHVTTRIAIGYGTDITPFSIESTYCPPCGQVPEHPWANGVTRYMAELEEYRKNL